MTIANKCSLNEFRKIDEYLINLNLFIKYKI